MGLRSVPITLTAGWLFAVNELGQLFAFKIAWAVPVAPKSIAQIPVPVPISSTFNTLPPIGARYSSLLKVNRNSWCWISVLVSCIFQVLSSCNTKSLLLCLQHGWVKQWNIRLGEKDGPHRLGESILPLDKQLLTLRIPETYSLPYIDDRCARSLPHTRIY